MDGSSERYRLAPPSPFPQTAKASGIRTVYAAANVVTDPLKLIDPQAAAIGDAERRPVLQATRVAEELVDGVAKGLPGRRIVSSEELA